MAEEERIPLERSDSYYTHDPQDAFLVTRGSVQVYIIPLRATGEAGRALPLRLVETNRVIPAFSHGSDNGRQWRFRITAASPEGAQLKLLRQGATLPLKRRFLQDARLDTWEEEGYEGSLLQYYHMKELKDLVSLERHTRLARGAEKAEQQMIRQAVTSSVTPEGWNTSPLYQVLAWACPKVNIQLGSEQLLSQACRSMTLTEIARVSHFICRQVVLEPGWYRQDSGIIIASLDGKPAALLPSWRGYRLYVYGSTDEQPLTPQLAGRIAPCASVIQPALPASPLGRKELTRFIAHSVWLSDLVRLGIFGLISTLLCLILPMLTRMVFDTVIPMGSVDTLLQLGMIAAVFMLGCGMIDLVRQLLLQRIAGRAGARLQSAAYHRMFELPQPFFRSADSTELASRVYSIGSLTSFLTSKTAEACFSLLLGLVDLYLMYRYSPRLTITCLQLMALQCLAVTLLSRLLVKPSAALRRERGIADSRMHQLMTGMEKLRLAGAEKQAIQQYLLPFSRAQHKAIHVDRLSAWVRGLMGASSGIIMLALYAGTGRRLSVGTFVAFCTAYGFLSVSVAVALDACVSWQRVRPHISLLQPFLRQAPQNDGRREMVTDVTGQISVEHVSFSYGKDLPLVLDDLDLHIEPGEYVAVVGPSGCGKSTLLKLLLGFEEPLKGQVCYDGRNLASLDKHSLRCRLGVVLQDGKLISGTIRDNITITAPDTTDEQVNRVVEAVGLKEELSRLPMNLETLVNEGGGTLSGGQIQRILIARAICSNPRILLLDEATSALDNATQSLVCRSLQQQGMTRLVIAHRLSTVMDCDRILVMDKGRIAEEGTYEDLMDRQGLFWQLATRQLAE